MLLYPEKSKFAVFSFPLLSNPSQTDQITLDALNQRSYSHPSLSVLIALLRLATVLELDALHRSSFLFPHLSNSFFELRILYISPHASP